MPIHRIALHLPHPLDLGQVSVGPGTYVGLEFADPQANPGISEPSRYELILETAQPGNSAASQRIDITRQVQDGLIAVERLGTGDDHDRAPGAGL